MEYLDIYDEFDTYLGKELRNVVHEKGLWHYTVHCWLYDKFGNIYFQIRKEEGTLYTTASGHVLAGESVKEAFGREVKEEIGISIDYENAILVEVNNFVMDKVKKDGSLFKDRAKAHVYVAEFDGKINGFCFDTEEVKGLVKMKAMDVRKLFCDEVEKIKGQFILKEEEKITFEARDILKEDFLVNEGETLPLKYGSVIDKVIEITK